ncbi:uncharacterized protein [Halyomorpha halys]|uniref:uncharacterized protein n=1 Tax=Halyomorpha halys TaxID=286706 RepID=UPI0006D4EC98|nr:uncharacterized protein LOC106690301 [Halyomorpha halys]
MSKFKRWSETTLTLRHGRVADILVTMNTKLWILIAILCVVQSAYSVDLSAFSGQIGTWFDIYEKGSDNANNKVAPLLKNIKPPPPGLKYCPGPGPGWCCPIQYECRGLHCYDPVTGNKEHSVLVC